MFFSSVCKILHFLCSENPFIVTISFVSKCNCNSLWLGYDLFRMYRNVIPYVYADVRTVV